MHVGVFYSCVGKFDRERRAAGAIGGCYCLGGWPLDEVSTGKKAANRGLRCGGGDMPQLAPARTMDETLGAFAQSDCERLPVTSPQGDLLGVLSKTDVLLFLAGKPRDCHRDPD